VSPDASASSLPSAESGLWTTDAPRCYDSGCAAQVSDSHLNDCSLLALDSTLLKFVY